MEENAKRERIITPFGVGALTTLGPIFCWIPVWFMADVFTVPKVHNHIGKNKLYWIFWTWRMNNCIWGMQAMNLLYWPLTYDELVWICGCCWWWFCGWCCWSLETMLFGELLLSVEFVLGVFRLLALRRRSNGFGRGARVRSKWLCTLLSVGNVAINGLLWLIGRFSEWSIWDVDEPCGSTTAR